MALLLRRLAAVPSAAPLRSFASAAGPAINWADVRAKMMTEDTRADADRARDAFQKRLAAAEAVGKPGAIDWESYKKALPEINVDALRKEYDAVVKAIPAVTYDETADKAAHEVKEAAWNSFANYCATRVAELQSLQGEQAKHKLHKWYRRRQLYNRFPGLYESLHHKVRGAWDVQVWSNYLAYRGGLTQLPWDPNFGEVDESKRREIMLNIAGRANVKPEELGFNVPAAAAPAAAAPANKH